MVKKYIPKQGDVVFLNFNPQAGKEQKGKRPALVISPEKYNQKVGLALFCPITNQTKGYPFEVILPEKGAVKGAILSDHIKSLDWKQRKAKLICKAPKTVLEEVMQKIDVLLHY